MVKSSVLFLLFWNYFEVIGDCRLSTVQYEPENRFDCSAFLASTMFGDLRRLIKQNNMSKHRVALKMEDILLDNDVKMLEKNWLMAPVQLQILVLSKITIYGIEDDAFNDSKFEWLQELEFHDLPIRKLSEGTFNGLKNLWTLRFHNADFVSFTKNVFATVPNMRRLTMDNCGSKKLVLDNLFGSNAMPNLQNLVINHCNLKDTITESTFKSLNSIILLNLGQNEIQHIGARSFDVVFQTLRRLYLKWNYITSLDGELFKVHGRNRIRIEADENAFHCDCELEPFRQLIQSADHFDIDEIKCTTPPEYEEVILKNAPSLCLEPDQYVPSNDELSKNLSKNDLSLLCDKSIDIGKSVTLTLSKCEPTIILRNENKQLIIDALHFSSDRDLIGFEVNQLENDDAIIQCLANIRSDNAKNLRFERNLTLNRFYRFCSKERKLQTVGPLDCISFYSGFPTVELIRSDDVWIMMDNKAISATIFVLCSVFAFIIGITTSFVLAKWFPSKFQDKKIDMAKEEALGVQEYEAVKRFRSSDKPLWRRFESTKLKRPMNQMSAHNAVFQNFDKAEPSEYLSIGEIPPPLPPRKSLHEMPKCCNSDNCQCYCDLF